MPRPLELNIDFPAADVLQKDHIREVLLLLKLILFSQTAALV